MQVSYLPAGSQLAGAAELTAASHSGLPGTCTLGGEGINNKKTPTYGRTIGLVQ